MLVMLSWHCTQAQFGKQNLDFSDILLDTYLSQSGLQRYTNVNIALIRNILLSITLPPIDLTILGIKLIFTDMRVANIEMNNLDLRTTTYGIDIAFQNWHLDLQFNFKILQTSFPYLTDSGIGKVRLTVESLLSFNILSSESCVYHPDIKLRSANLHIFDLDVQMVSELSFLYESILHLIATTIEDVFNESLQQVIVQLMIGIMRMQLEKMSCISQRDDQKYITDQRWYQMNFNSTHDYVASSGQLQYREDVLKFTGWNNVKRIEHKQYATAQDTQYMIQKDMFQASINAFLFQNTKQVVLTITKVVHTGILATFKLENARANILLIPKIGFYRDKQANDIVQFELMILKVLDVEGDRNIITEFVAEFNQKIGQYLITYSTGNGLDAKTCQTYYFDSNWVMMGCNFKKE